MESASQNILSTFLNATQAFPEKVALIHDGSSITYQQLEAEIKNTAAVYAEKGLKKGDKVLVFVPMSLSLYRIVLTLLYLGACPVFLDQWVSLKRLKACLQTVPCQGLIAPKMFLFLSGFIGSLRRIPIRLSTNSGRVTDLEIRFPAAVEPDATALVTFTTGSTGIPKAADRTHRFLHAQLKALSPSLEGVESPCLTTLPIVVLLHLAAGRTTLLPPKRFKLSKPKSYSLLSRSLKEFQARSLIASPSVVKGLLNLDSGRTFRYLGKVLTGGGPVYPDLANDMTEGFPNAETVAVYGSTEAEPISHISAQELSTITAEMVLERGLPVGTVDPSATIRILRPDIDSRSIQTERALVDACLPTGETGEVIVAGDHVLRHYIHNPEAEAEIKIRIGNTVWHRTGDCGRLDDSGKLFLLGRCKDRFHWNNCWHYPDLLNYYFTSKLSGQVVAVVFVNERPVMVFEGSPLKSKENMEALLLETGLSDARLTKVRKIPRDPRHHTKIDYGHLAQMVKN